MRKDSILVEKSMDFAIRAVNLYKYLTEQKREYVISKQMLRCATSIGANVREAIYAQSRKDFVGKLSIALKETSETEYWLELLHRTDYLNAEHYKSIGDDCSEIERILTASVKSSKLSNEP